ncbi:AcrR family transcriptional regulator [Natronospira proteinivora]|uniref:AcrR family transcriptional regulator n=1 Tax=Natronospira proteinivora TaxID=1807133 RepID=A0ABT1G9G0_9GAMM|nr:TetR/AcrR family transcriptional regulator [Natronospira proteinivora]MCP1726963.1 AcrR family transcriptional regulator [Natronospira proteinivora]
MESQRRKKQPDLVRRRLIEAGISIAVEHGLAAATVQAVSDKAGVTKGGFLHHFPSKRALITAIIKDLITSAEREINEHMAEDPDKYGSFTRAYIEFSLNSAWEGLYDRPTAIAILAISDSELRSIWADWYNEMQRKHRQTDGDEHLAIIRLTADGLWLAALSDLDIPNLAKIRERLLDRTRN